MRSVLRCITVDISTLAAKMPRRRFVCGFGCYSGSLQVCQDTDADPSEEMIIGIVAAARYLGYDKPDSFRRARTRHPIPGEGKTDDGRPLLDSRSAAERAERPQDRRQPHTRRAGLLPYQATFALPYNGT
jgi:hypothetical protein